MNLVDLFVRGSNASIGLMLSVATVASSKSVARSNLIVSVISLVDATRARSAEGNRAAACT